MVKRQQQHEDSQAAGVAELEPHDGAELDLAAPVAEVELPALPAKFTAADVLQADDVYDARDVERLLGVPTRLTATGFGYAPTVHSLPRLQGADVLAWLEREQVRYTLTSAGSNVAKRNAYLAECAAEDATRAASAASNDPFATLLDGAEVALRRAKTETWTERDQLQAYCILLIRAETPLPSDQAELADHMHELKLSRQDVARDLELVRRLPALLAEHALLPERRAAASKALAGLSELRARHKRELAEAVHQVNETQALESQSKQAIDSALSLARGRQELFSDLGQATNKPVLLGENQE